jgi:hypothetical protein
MALTGKSNPPIRRQRFSALNPGLPIICRHDVAMRRVREHRGC